MNFIKQFIVKLGLKWVDRDQVIAWAYTLVKQPVDTYLGELKWEQQDSLALDEFLKTESGKRFLGVIVENKNRSLQTVLNAKDQNEVEKIKGQANAWIALRSNLEVLRKPVKTEHKDKLSPEQLETAFTRVMNSSIQVTNSNHAVRKN